MKYFLDTEFIEGPQKERFPVSLFRKHTVNTIDLISIGIVAEDGREYYAISKDFNLEEAWNRFDLKTNVNPDFNEKKYWLRENVLKPIFDELYWKDTQRLSQHKRVLGWAPDCNLKFCYKDLRYLLNRFGKTNKEIAEDIISFCRKNENKIHYHNDSSKPFDWTNPEDKNYYYAKLTHQAKDPEFYAYYADYDWVVFCWLFGKMMDLPNGFPMYCTDLKQMFDDNEVAGIYDYPFGISTLKEHTNYPKQDPSKSHNAIDDARWNKQLYEFLKQL